VKPGASATRDKLKVVFAFLVIYGIVLFLIQPSPNPAQVTLRTGIILVGVTGLVLLYFWR